MAGKPTVCLLAVLLAVATLSLLSAQQEDELLPALNWKNCTAKGVECQWMAQLPAEEYANGVAANADIVINSDDDDDDDGDDDSSEEDSGDDDSEEEDGDDVGTGTAPS